MTRRGAKHAARPDHSLALRRGMEEPNRFQKLVAEAKKNIKEISSNDAALELGCGAATLIDVRSDEDWKAEHARGAKHLNRGEIEVEIEEQVPISISESFVIAAAAVAPHSSRRACKRWVIATCAP